MPRLDDTSEQNILNMLMEHSMVSAEQMHRITTMSKEVGKSKLETAFELNLADEKKILNLLSKTYSLDIVDLKPYKVDEKLKKIVDARYIVENSLVPFEISNGTLKIAIPDASKLSLMKNLKTITKMDPELYAASISDINDFIIRLVGEDTAETKKVDSKKNKISTSKEEGKRFSRSWIRSHCVWRENYLRSN